MRSSAIAGPLDALYARTGKDRLKSRGGLGASPRLVMDARHLDKTTDEGSEMAEEEPLLVDPPTQDVAMHVQDYTRFTKLLKWGSLVALAVAFFVMLILK